MDRKKQKIKKKILQTGGEPVSGQPRWKKGNGKKERWTVRKRNEKDEMAFRSKRLWNKRRWVNKKDNFPKCQEHLNGHLWTLQIAGLIQPLRERMSSSADGGSFCYTEPFNDQLVLDSTYCVGIRTTMSNWKGNKSFWGTVTWKR